MKRFDLQQAARLRAERMAHLFTQEHKTLKEIGDIEGVTRERVRQILFKMGIKAKDGGARARARTRRADIEAKRDLAYLHRYGMTRRAYREISKATGYLAQHRYRSFERSMRLFYDEPYLLTFGDWWELWHKSGHWSEYGRERDQYVLARIIRPGPFIKSNMQVIKSQENISSAIKRSWRIRKFQPRRAEV